MHNVLTFNFLIQTKSDFETQQKKAQGDRKESTTTSTNKNIQVCVSLLNNMKDVFASHRVYDKH